MIFFAEAIRKYSRTYLITLHCFFNNYIFQIVWTSSAIALISKYATKGWKDVQVAYADKEKSEEVVRVLSYLEVVEKVKHRCDETEVITLIEEHKLEREQLLTDHLKSKQVQ